VRYNPHTRCWPAFPAAAATSCLSQWQALLCLTLLGGCLQVEAEPPTWVSSDMSHAALLNRALVEGVNCSIKEKGTNKVRSCLTISPCIFSPYTCQTCHDE
jgi:hypothetical protein